MKEEIGFVGLGNMGAPMAKRMLAAGFPLVVFDSNPAAIKEFTRNGAAAVNSVQEMSERVQTIFLSLPTPDVVKRVAEDLSGQALVRVVDLSTTGPEASRQLAQDFAKRDVRWLDSPVSGGVSGAVAGTISVMFSGQSEDFNDLRPALESIGKPFYIGGSAGLAQMMKLVNNILSATAMAATAEALAMGAKSGIDAEVMLDVINVSSGRNTATMDKFPNRVLTGSFDTGFSTGLMCKDARLFVQTAKESGFDVPACAAMLTQWEAAVEKLGGDSDFSRIAELAEQRAGVTLRAKEAKQA
jgi:3-hydroxyisobutyrate dehydrogenase-like beta-hydroxyacid dehydrogenase